MRKTRQQNNALISEGMSASSSLLLVNPPPPISAHFSVSRRPTRIIAVGGYPALQLIRRCADQWKFESSLAFECAESVEKCVSIRRAAVRAEHRRPILTALLRIVKSQLKFLIKPALKRRLNNWTKLCGIRSSMARHCEILRTSNYTMMKRTCLMLWDYFNLTISFIFCAAILQGKMDDIQKCKNMCLPK
jgi:hypothetical protein